jgi:hypothetical protein
MTVFTGADVERKMMISDLVYSGINFCRDPSQTGNNNIDIIIF